MTRAKKPSQDKSDAKHAKRTAKTATLEAKAALAETRARLKELKKHGLYTGDLRRSPTRYAKSLIGKFGDVLSGRAAVVKTTSRATAKVYDKGYKTKGKLVIVPTDPTRVFTFNKKTGEIEGRRTLPSGKVAVSRILPHQPGQTPAFGPVPPGKTRWYSIMFRRGKKLVLGYRTDSWAEMQNFMAYYEDFNDWQDYVITEDV
jgi:hypothetical protein